MPACLVCNVCQLSLIIMHFILNKMPAARFTSRCMNRDKTTENPKKAPIPLETCKTKLKRHANDGICNKTKQKPTGGLADVRASCWNVNYVN